MTVHILLKQSIPQSHCYEYKAIFFVSHTNGFKVIFIVRLSF